MTINENELADARGAWGNGMIAISKAYEKSGIDDATIVANEMLDQLYGFEFGPVLFKPTLSGGSQTFRSNKEGALSYFIGGDIKEDNGFALKPWESIDLVEVNSIEEDSLIITMGAFNFKPVNQDVITLVAFTFLLLKDKDSFKIKVHHSSPV
mgnify:CR=1 FL=1